MISASEVFEIQGRENLYIIGLMGGIASGKSTVADIFQQLGGFLISADQMVHEVLVDSDIQNQIASQWGKQLIVKGQIDKKSLADVVFSSPDNLKILENIIHPVIRRGIRDKLQGLASSGKHRVIFDIALLWERGLHQGCDLLIFIESNLAARKTRAVDNRGWQEEQLEQREKHQTDLITKKNAANIVIVNKTLEDTYSQAREIWGKLP